MTLAATLLRPELPALMLLAGFAVGLAYFASLRRCAALLVAGSGWAAPLALTLGRFAAAGVFLVFAARLGGVALLAALAGFLAARALSLRLDRRQG